MKPNVIERLRNIVETESGIQLGPDKVDLLLNRIRRRLRALNLDREEQYLQVLETDLHGRELVELINVVSTNHTFFYREHQHFEQLGKILEEYTRLGKNKVRIWCAASSSGEEPYMLAMMVQEHYRVEGGDARILATDISTNVLQKAQKGVYEEHQLEKLPPQLKEAYFSKVEGNSGFYQVIPSLKDLILFKRLNLSRFPYPLNGPLDIIFCRNVMIYFDIALRSQIVHECERLLAAGGYLFLSLSENTLGINHRMTPHGVGTYRKGR